MCNTKEKSKKMKKTQDLCSFYKTIKCKIIT